MQTISSIRSFYETSYYVFIGLTALILAVRVWRVYVTWESRLIIFKIKGFGLEKMLKGGFFISLILGIISIPPLLLVGSTPSLLINPILTYVLFGLSLAILLLELGLCTTVSRSLMERNSKKGLLSFIVIFCLFVFAQFVGAALHIYTYPSEAETVLLDALPFKEGKWLVIDGGSSEHINYNHVKNQTKYGASLVLLERDDFFKNTGADNADFFAFGQPVRSPVSGRVEAVVDSLPDVPPVLGAPSALTTLGNYVSIELSPNQYVVLSNLKQHSVKVKKDSTLALGAEVGAVGHSVMKGWPQLCFHVQDKSTKDTTATGLPFRIKNITVKRWLYKQDSKTEFLLRHDVIN